MRVGTLQALPPHPPDALHDIRSEMMLTMIECGLKVEAQHHEVATGGQGEIDMKYAPLVEMADNVLKYKYIVTWIWYKREKEVDAIRLRPHPYEFALYFDI